MRTIAVFNRKGGSGKTTTAVNLAAALGEQGHRVLVVDLDPQASATDWLGHEPSRRSGPEPRPDFRQITRLVERTGTFAVDIIPATAGLASAELTLRADLSVAIARAIQSLDRRWGFVIVDCPPTLSYVAVGILAGVREVLIPVEAHAIALPGIRPVLEEIQRLRASLRTNLTWATVVPCRVNRTRHAWAVIETLGADYGPLVSSTSIRESIRVAEAWTARLPVTRFAPDCAASDDFRRLAAEVAGGPGAGNEIRAFGLRWRDAPRSALGPDLPPLRPDDRLPRWPGLGGPPDLAAPASPVGAGLADAAGRRL